MEASFEATDSIIRGYPWLGIFPSKKERMMFSFASGSRIRESWILAALLIEGREQALSVDESSVPQIRTSDDKRKRLFLPPKNEVDTMIHRIREEGS